MTTRVRSVHTVPLISILLIAGIVRLLDIDRPFVDRDGWRQSETAMMAENISLRWNLLYPEVNWDGPGPSYAGMEFQTVTFLAAVAYTVFGQADWVGRTISVAFGILGILALHNLIALVWDRERALAGAAVMAVLPGSIFVGSSFLPDPAMVALVTTGSWLLIAYLLKRRSVLLALAAATSSLAFLTKLNGLCVVLPMVFSVCRVCWSQPSRLIAFRRLVVAGAVTVAPAVLYYAWAWHISRTYPPYHLAGTQDFVWTRGFEAWWRDGYYLRDLQWHLPRIWTRLGFLLVGLGLVLPPPSPDRAAGSSYYVRWFFHWWLLIAGGGYFVIGAAHLARQPYNLHLFDPPAAALVGHALVAVSAYARPYVGRITARALVLGAVVAIALTGMGTVRSSSEAVSSTGYRMGLALRGVTAPGDLVVTLPEFLGDPVALYYSRRHGWVFPPAAEWSEIDPDWDAALLTEAAVGWLDRLRTGGAGWIGMVDVHHERIRRGNPALAAYLDRHFEPGIQGDGYVIFRAR